MEDFIQHHVDDATKREFLGHVVDAATAARSPWKIRVLAKAFVRGARDGDLIDETEMFVALVRELEPPHVRCLAAAINASETDRVVTARKVQGADKAIGHAAALLLRDLSKKGLLIQLDPTASAGYRRAQGADEIGDGTANFQVTDVGVAVGAWFEAIDREPKPSMPGDDPAASGG